MKANIIREILLYRYRYIIGYGLYVAALIVLIFSYVVSLPGGLHPREIQSVVESTQFSLTSPFGAQIVDAPYKLLQSTSIAILGLTTFAIKLPSLIIGVLTGLCLALMLRRWFSVNVAVLGGLLAVSSTPFLIMSRSGTPDIMLPFWIALLLLCATRILHGSKMRVAWKLAAFVCAGLSMYTPLALYALISIAIAGLLHPHVRYILRRTRPSRYILVIVMGLLVLAPLVVSIITDPRIGLVLLGVPNEYTVQSLLSSAAQSGSLLFGFAGTEFSSMVIAPLFGLATLSLIILGLIRCIVDYYSARSYMMLIWLVMTLVALVLSSGNVLAIFLPGVLLLAIGIETLIREWYRLFPKNPYARIVALVPLAILLGSIGLSNAVRYYYGSLYHQPIVSSYSRELGALQEVLSEDALNKTAVTIIAPEDTRNFYGLLSKRYDYVALSDAPTTGRGSTIIFESEYEKLDMAEREALGEPQRLVTDFQARDSLLLRIFTRW